MKLLATTALAALVATGAAAQTPAPPHARGLSPDTPLVNITVEGRSDQPPDIASFTAGVVAQGNTAGEAMQANAARMNAVVAALRGAGVADRDIRTSRLSLQPQYHRPTPIRSADGIMIMPNEPPRIIGYEARNTVSIRMRNIGRMGQMIDALVSAGANEVNGPSFAVEEPDDAADEARADALRKARSRAELYAREAGFRSARLLTISEGGGYYPIQHDSQVITVTGQSRGGGIPPLPVPPVAPLQGGQVTVGVTLSVQFALER